MAETTFLIELTKKELAKAAEEQITNRDSEIWCSLGMSDITLRYAQHKKWVSSDGDKVTAAGLAVATSFLKR